MARPSLPEGGKDSGPQSTASPFSYRPLPTGGAVAYRVSVACRIHPQERGGLATARGSKRGEQSHAPQAARRSPTLLAGGGLCLALICAFGDGFLTADQMRPVFIWFRLHQSVPLRTGILSYLIGHWPEPRFHWAPLIWIGIGLMTATAGKGALLPALRLARLAGPRAALTLRLLVLIAGLSGILTLISERGEQVFSSPRYALTSSTHTLTPTASPLDQ